MRILRAIAVVLTVVMMVGRYFQERKRLAIVSRLPGDHARLFYESTRRIGDRSLIVVTALFVSGAVAAVVYYVYFFGARA